MTNYDERILKNVFIFAVLYFNQFITSVYNIYLESSLNPFNMNKYEFQKSKILKLDKLVESYQNQL